MKEVQYVYRKAPNDRDTFEVGECDSPRSNAGMWCDRRICESFGGIDQARSIVDALNIMNMINQGLSIRSDSFGDWFVAGVWDTDISTQADSPIDAALSAFMELKLDTGIEK